MKSEIAGEQHKALLAKNKPQRTSLLIKYAPMASVAIIFVILSFFGGVQYQKGRTNKQASPSATAGDQANPLGGFQGGAGRRMGMRGILGPVTAISPTSISVQNTRTNSVNTLDITSDTIVTNNGQTASVTDIKVGDNVIARPNPSNAKQALQINLNPQMMDGANTPTPTPSQSN